MAGVGAQASGLRNERKEHPMLLPKEQAEQFHRHLQRAEVPNECPVCHAPHTLVSGAELVAQLMYTTLREGTSPMRTVRCVCPRCAAVTSFDAAAIGITLPSR